MEHETPQFRKETMQRIYMVFLMKKLYGRIAIKTYILAGLIYLQAKLIFVKQIFMNMPAITDIGAVYHFYSYAFLNTRSIVQITTVIAIATILFIFRDFFRKDRYIGYNL